MNLFESSLAKCKTDTNSIYLEAVSKIFNILFEDQMQTGEPPVEDENDVFINSTDARQVLLTYLEKLVTLLMPLDHLLDKNGRHFKAPDGSEIIDNNGRKREFLTTHFGGVTPTSPITVLKNTLEHAKDMSITDSTAFSQFVSAVDQLYDIAVAHDASASERLIHNLKNAFDSKNAENPNPEASRVIYTNIIVPLTTYIAKLHDVIIPKIKDNPKMRRLRTPSSKQHSVYIGHDFLTSDDEEEANIDDRPSSRRHIKQPQEAEPALDPNRFLDGTVDSSINPDSIIFPVNTAMNPSNIVENIKSNLIIIQQKVRNINRNYFSVKSRQIQNDDGSSSNAIEITVESKFILDHAKLYAVSAIRAHSVLAYALYLDAKMRYKAGTAMIGGNIAEAVNTDMAAPLKNKKLNSMFPSYDLESIDAFMPTYHDILPMLSGSTTPEEADSIAQKVSMVLTDSMLEQPKTFYDQLSNAITANETSQDDFDFFSSFNEAQPHQNPYKNVLIKSKLYDKLQDFIAARKSNAASTGESNSYNIMASKLVQSILSARSFSQVKKDEYKAIKEAEKNKPVFIADYDNGSQLYGAAAADDANNVDDNDDVDI